MNSKPRVIFCFDFGLKHIGIAVGQELTNTTETFFSLKAFEGKPNWKELDSLIKEWKPDLFVVGDPVNMDGTCSELKKKSDRFSTLIKRRYNIPFELMDERLTSREAKDIIKSSGDNRFKGSLDTHQMSAKIILESWFEEKS